MFYTLAKRIFPWDEHKQTNLVFRAYRRCFPTKNSLCSLERLTATFYQLTRTERKTPKEKTNQTIPDNSAKPAPLEHAGGRQHFAKRIAEFLSKLSTKENAQ